MFHGLQVELERGIACIELEIYPSHGLTVERNDPTAYTHMTCASRGYQCHRKKQMRYLGVNSWSARRGSHAPNARDNARDGRARRLRKQAA
jgi:hypothetical protein